MFKKLIKYDLKELFSISWIIYIIVITLSIILLVFNSNKLYAQNILLDLLNSVLTIVLMILLVLLFGFTIYKILKRFSKNYYSDEGYLTQTLPVDKKSLYFSKFISSIIYLISSGFIILTAYTLGLTFIFTNNSCLFLEGECYSSTIESSILEFSILFNGNYIIVLLIIIVICFIEILLIVLSGYNGIIINHLNSNPKKIKSVLYSIIIYLVSCILFASIFYFCSKINPSIAKIFSMKQIEFYNNIKNNIETCKLIMSIGIFSYIGIDLLLLFNGYRLFDKGINLE